MQKKSFNPPLAISHHPISGRLKYCMPKIVAAKISGIEAIGINQVVKKLVSRK